MAKLLHYFNKVNYNYSEDDNWYVFKNHKWVKTGKKCSILKNKIKDLESLYGDLILYYKNNGNDLKKITILKKIQSSLNNTVCRNNIMHELSDIYLFECNLNRDFLKKLDNNNYLIGFENGVYDLQKNEFRDGKMEDYICMTTGYSYNNNYSNKYEDLLKFLHDILPNESEYEYFMLYLSCALYGNTLELFSILTGCGRNGKSKLIELIKLTFGNYFSAVSSQMLTRPRPDSNQPDPGLLNLAKKRIVIASEPEKNCKLNTGFLKFITGRDTTTLRNCHSNETVDFSPKFLTFLIFLICNDIPDCDDIDNAFSRRLRCINFPTEFVDNPINNKQKLIDTNINEKFDSWKNDFMLLLINYYKKYSETKKLVCTDKILKWTNKYKEEADIYLTFLSNCTKASDGNTHCADLYTIFKIWFNENNPGVKKPTNKEFICGIKKYKKIEKIKINSKTQLGIRSLAILYD